MKDVGSLQVLKRRLHFHPTLLDKAKSSKLRKTMSHDSMSAIYKSSPSSSQASTHSQANQGKYRILKLNENLSLSIGDSIESNPDPNTTCSKFEYGQIRYPKQVRLLLVLPAFDPDEPLETLLFHADLGEVPFQALSLHSGGAAKTATLHCNGKGLAVTEKAHSALLSVRNLGDVKAISIVWVHDICVNPADPREREAHLRLFRDIHSSSVVTTVWLGGTLGQQEKVFKTIDILHEACQCDEFRERLERDELDLSSLDHLSIGEKTLQIPFENRAELSTLFSHPWFEQVWGFQEVVVAKKAFVLYGGGVRPWSYIADAAWCMHQLHWESGLNPDLSMFGDRSKLKHHHVLHLDDHRDGFQENKMYGLLELLTASRNFTSTQAQDRVFALCGLLGDAKEHDIVETFLDYALTPLSLFLNITVNMMQCHQTLDVLHLVSNDPAWRSTSWPSFVPDLANKNTARQIGSRTGRESWEYHAAGNTKPQLRIINGKSTIVAGIPHYDDDVHIGLMGLIIDEVGAVGSEMKDTGVRVASFLADWINTAIMTGGKKFYTTNELKKVRDVLLSPKAEPKGEPVADQPNHMSIGEFQFPTAARRPSLGTGISEFPTGSRRPSLGGIANRRSSVSAETKGNLRNSFAPALLDAMKNLEVQPGEDSPTIPPEISQKIVHSTKSSNAATSTAASGLTSQLPDEEYPLGKMSVAEAFWRTLVRDRDRDGLRPSLSTKDTYFQPWFDAANGGVGKMLEALQPGNTNESGERPVATFNDWVHAASAGSRIMRTRNGYIGTGPRWMEEGDLLCVLYGGQTPFVLRREAWGNYRFIGDCYVQGIMDGEALTMELDETEFVLV